MKTFLAQLHHYSIDAVVDVRSVPFSAYYYEFDQNRVASSLKQNNIYYIDLGKELGPRSKNPEHYDKKGQVQFDRLMNSSLFNEGVNRLLKGLEKGFTIALMCAEKDPSHCHRSLLIADSLEKRYNITVQHITHEGALESESELKYRLLESGGFESDLFFDQNALLKKAYEQQIRKKAYRKD
ncbi:MAG: DUF488 domain-containing protein [Pseudomonadota bacterium]